MEEINGTPKSIEDIKSKDKFTGTVVKTMLAGAAVDIGVGVPGFIHISQLQSEKVNRVEDVVEEGQTVEVWVKRVYPKKDRIELTMIEPLALEWREIKEGMTVKGTIDRLEKYGAFVEIGAERPGLAHISELTHDYVRAPEDAVKVGEEVEAKIIDFSRRKKQIKLSLKAMKEEPVEEQPEEEVETVEVLTAMEIAYRKALGEQSEEDATPSAQAAPSGKSKSEQDDIISRTLEHKAKTK